MLKSLMVIALVVSGTALAQAASSDPLPPPPLVDATPPPMPAPDPSTPPPPVPTATQQQPGTPPPPSALPPPGYVPGRGAQGQSGYAYSPYGQPKSQEKPGPEIGLMVSESLFGMLTAAGITVLPYFLLFNSGIFEQGNVIGTVLLCVIFGATPLAVAQTEVSLANGSRHYQSDTWPAALTGLVGMGGVLGIYAALGGFAPATASTGGAPNGDPVAQVVWLMVGAIGIVPLLEMAAINLFKQPRPGFNFAFGDPVKGHGIAFNPPSIAPIVSTSNNVAGAQLSLFSGRW